MGFGALRLDTGHPHHRPGAVLHAPVTHGFDVNQEGPILASCHACSGGSDGTAQKHTRLLLIIFLTTNLSHVGFDRVRDQKRGHVSVVTFDQLGAGEAEHARVAREVQPTGQPNRTAQDVLLVVLQEWTQHGAYSKQRKRYTRVE